MNPFKRPKPMHPVRRFLLTVLNGSMFLVAFGIMAHIMPMEMTFVAPEAPESAVVKSAHDKAVERTSAKCGEVVKGEFPTAAIVDWETRVPKYETSPGMVNYLFKVAVGELPLNPQIVEFKLCK